MPKTYTDDNVNIELDNEKCNRYDTDEKSFNEPEWNEELSKVVVGYH